MAIIGSFTKQEDGLHGTLRTLSLNVKCKIVPIAKEAGNGPDYRILAGSMEIGAAWKRQSKGNRDYLSVRIDDPSFPAPLNARLINDDDGNAQLYWTRRGEE